MDRNWRQALSERGARIEDGRVTGFARAQRDAELDASACALTALLSQGLIAAAGEDAQDFLQGQLSNDIGSVSRTRAQLAAYCTPKGRVLATLIVWGTEDGYALALPRELADPIRKRLQMYVLRSKVRLSDASDQSALLGVLGADAPRVVRNELGLTLSADYDVARGEGVTAIGLPGARIQLVVEAACADRIWDQLARVCDAVGEELWDAHGVATGIPVITAATQEQFTPHMLNLDLVGGVSFEKGCYTGQEIVARTQYLGHVKRRLARFSAAARPAPGSPVFADAAPVGLVVNAARSQDDEFELLAVTQAPRSGTLLRLAPGGPALRSLPLPYRVPDPARRSDGDSD